MTLRFRYMPLTRPEEIRVLYFDPRANQGPDELITLRLAHFTITELRDRGSKYNALSYTWGTDQHDRIVKINEGLFNVSPNLEAALRNIWAKEGGGIYWIDAICINQKDNLEKNVQVAMMGEIYAASDLTLVWLGECNPVIAEAIDMLEAGTVTHDDNGLPVIDLNHTLGDLKYKSAWSGVGQLLGRPWWRRIWVIQEIVLGRRAVILCGTKALMFQRLSMGAEFAFGQASLKDIFPVCENGFSNYWRVQSMMDYRMKRQSDKPTPLQLLLDNNVSCEAGDPRDRVFSLLGLATDVQDAPELVIDYAMPIEQVYASAVRFHVRKYKSLDLICHSTHPKSLENVPSWVPDFASLKETTAEALAAFRLSYPPKLYWYSASGTSTSNEDAFSHGPDVLSASAIFVDKIAHMGDVCWPGRFAKLLDCLQAWLCVADAVLDFESEYVAGGSVFEAFNRTLCGDKARSGFRAPRGWRGYEALMDTAIPDDFRLGPDVDEEVRREAWVGDALRAVELRSRRRRFIVTETGFLGLGPPEAKVGDAVAILLGCSVPVVLRPWGKNWWFVGESYICGIMDGEILKDTHMNAEGTDTSDENGPTSKKYQVEQVLFV